MKPTQSKIAGFWCRLMHSEPMWPSHGQYECRTCGRRHRVCWDLPVLAAPRTQASPREMLAHSASLTATEARIQCSYQ
jgi:hypothetical protein